MYQLKELMLDEVNRLAEANKIYKYSGKFEDYWNKFEERCAYYEGEIQKQKKLLRRKQIEKM